METQHYRCVDDCDGKSDICRALFHARALQLTSGVGDRGFRALLDRNFVRADLQRLFDAWLDFSWLLSFTRPDAASFPALRSSAYTKDSSTESWRLTFLLVRHNTDKRRRPHCDEKGRAS